MSELEELIQQTHEVLEKSKKTTMYSPIGKFLLKVRQKYKTLSDADFTVLVAEAFRLTPQMMFMAYLYPDLIRILKKRIGDDRVEEMIKFILEKYSFYEGESVLFEFNGIGIQRIKDIKGTAIKIKSARIYMTNQRIIVNGVISESKFINFLMGGWLGLALGEPMDVALEVRYQQKLTEGKSCFGYEMPIRPIEQIIRKPNEINYIVKRKVEGKKKLKTFNISLISEARDDLDKIESILNSNQ